LVGPLLLYELRVRLRGSTAYALLTAIILAFGGFTLATYRAVVSGVHPLPVQVSAFGSGTAAVQPAQRLLIAERGPLFFLLMAVWAVVLMAFVIPASTSGCLARERERHTLELLIGTPARPSAIVMAKLLGAVSYVLLVLAAAVPLFSVVVLFGGISLEQAFNVALILAISTFAFGAVGVFFSAITENSLLASVLTYTVVLGLGLGSYAAYLISLPLGAALNLRDLLYLSPVAAMVSTLTQANSQLAELLMPYFREPGAHILGAPLTGSAYPVWEITPIAYLAVGIIFTIAASRAVDPLRRWL